MKNEIELRRLFCGGARDARDGRGFNGFTKKKSNNDPKPFSWMKSRVLQRVAVCSSLVFCAALHAQEPWLQFPTANRALLDGRLPDFYMYVDRDFEGEKSYPWEGGQYGLIRSPKREGGNIVYTLFHEGIDIKPLQKSGSGEPLDNVLAAAKGTVAYVSNVASKSNYGKYVVLEHTLNGSSIYTVYAHLKSMSVLPGQYVRQGQKIGELGHTGVGIDKERAHLHFEICLLLNPYFAEWVDRTSKSPRENVHGIYNGINLQGINPAALLLAVNATPTLSFQDFLQQNPSLFQLTFNTGPDFQFVQRYPFLVVLNQNEKNTIIASEDNAHDRIQSLIAKAPAWKITFSKDVIPTRAEAVWSPVETIQVKWLGSGTPPIRYQSRGLVAGSPSRPQLTVAGARFIDLLVFRADKPNLRPKLPPFHRRVPQR